MDVTQLKKISKPLYGKNRIGSLEERKVNCVFFFSVIIAEVQYRGEIEKLTVFKVKVEQNKVENNLFKKEWK